MSDWKTFQVNKRFIGQRTEKATLLLFPDNSRYPYYVAWIPNKLIRQNGNGSYTIAIRPGFEVKIVQSVKNKNGTYEKKNELTISGEEMMTQFLFSDEL